MSSAVAMTTHAGSKSSAIASSASAMMTSVAAMTKIVVGIAEQATGP